MNTINYSGKMVDSDNNSNQVVPYNRGNNTNTNNTNNTQYKNVDLFCSFIVEKYKFKTEILSVKLFI